MSSVALGTFRSLRGFNYRMWACGALVSNIGTWMQRTAQDWLVLTQLTAHNATAVGIVMALQFGPQIVLLPVTGLAADRLNRRWLLFATQAALGLLALVLGVLTVTGAVRLWEVYVLALLQGCVTAFDAPVRQTFVAELVGEVDLPNAVALNSTSFHLARMVGPAVSGALVAAFGTGWSFLINAASFAAVLAALARLRPDELHDSRRSGRGAGGLTEGFRYVWRRADLKTILLMIFVIGTFGLNFPIFISTMSAAVYHAGASSYGVLSGTIAIGSVTGALLSARRGLAGVGLLGVAAACFGVGCAVAAVMPNRLTFGLVLVAIGMAAQTLTTSANSLVQLSTEPAMRGRVMAILLAILMGGTPLGAPIVGWVADVCGPRWSLAVGALSGFVAALVAVRHLARARGETT